MTAKTISDQLPGADFNRYVDAIERAANREAEILRDLRKQLREMRIGSTPSLSRQQVSSKTAKVKRLNRALSFHQKRCNELYRRLGDLRATLAA